MCKYPTLRQKYPRPQKPKMTNVRKLNQVKLYVDRNACRSTDKSNMLNVNKKAQYLTFVTFYLIFSIYSV